MSKITNITMAAAIVASAVIGGAASASAANFYGMNSSPYPAGGSNKSSAASRVMGAPRSKDVNATGSVKKEAAPSKPKVAQQPRAN